MRAAAAEEMMMGGAWVRRKVGQDSRAGRYKCRGLMICYKLITDLPTMVNRVHELHQGHRHHDGLVFSLITSRVVLPVWDWTEIGGQGGAVTIKLKVRKRYA
jgi:hypothetical protein